MRIRSAICGYAIACRLLELRLSRRNIDAYSESSEGPVSRRTYPLMVALHTIVLGGTLLFGGRARFWPAAAFLAVQPLRFWLIRSLGRGWNTRGVVPSDLSFVSDGPYAWLAHPNYTVVAIELFSLPAAFALSRLGAVASMLNAALLFVRIREEEALLGELPGYRDYLDSHRRLIPFVF